MTDTRLVDGLNDAIRQNPLAASLVGAGIFWMLFGNKVPSLAAALPGAARSVGESLTSTGQSVIDATVEAASDLAQGASTTARQAGDAASDVISRVVPEGAKVEAAKADGVEAFRSGAVAGKQLFGDAQRRLSESLESQPLLLGALGLAIGAGLASAFPATRLERDALGVQASATRERLESAAASAKDFALERGREILDEVQEEARVQGLTPDDAKRGLKDVAARVKNVARAARNSTADAPRKDGDSGRDFSANLRPPTEGSGIPKPANTS